MHFAIGPSSFVPTSIRPRVNPVPMFFILFIHSIIYLAVWELLYALTVLLAILPLPLVRSSVRPHALAHPVDLVLFEITHVPGPIPKHKLSLARSISIDVSAFVSLPCSEGLLAEAMLCVVCELSCVDLFSACILTLSAHLVVSP